MLARLWLLSIYSFIEFWEPLLAGILSAACVMTTSFSYYKVFESIRHHQRQIHAHQSGGNNAQPTINLAKYKKSVHSVLYIMFLLVICSLPNIVCVSVLGLLKIRTESSLVALHVSITLFYLSSSFNPLLYFWRMKEIRDQVKRLILKPLCRG